MKRRCRNVKASELKLGNYLPTIAIDVPMIMSKRPTLRALQAFHKHRVVTFPRTTWKGKQKRLYRLLFLGAFGGRRGAQGIR